MKQLVLLMMCVALPSSAARFECVRWTWVGTSDHRKVVCLEWRDRDVPKKSEKKK